MRIVTFFTLVAFCICASFSAALAQTPSSSEELLHGYPPGDFYYISTQIPSGLELSNKKEDKINLALHHKMVAFEKESLQPLKSLDKNQLEALLQQWQEDALKELGYWEPKEVATHEPPKPKPALIEE